MQSRFLFLSHVLNLKTPLYGNSGKLELERSRRIESGDSSNNTQLHLPAHAGTHIDAPHHFDQHGQSLDRYPPDFWICRAPYLVEKEAGPGVILEVDDWRSELEKVPEDTDLLLVKTGFEKFRINNEQSSKSTYIFNGPGFSAGIGLWLRRNRKLKMIGFDFISLTSYQNRELGRVAHRAFLQQEPEGVSEKIGDPILIIEDMHLSGLQSSPKLVSVSPLRFEKADGSSVTVIAEVVD